MNKKLIEKFRHFVILSSEDYIAKSREQVIPILESAGLNGMAEFQKICAETAKETLSDDKISEIMNVMFSLFKRLMPQASQEEIDLFIDGILDRLIFDLKMNQQGGGAA